MQLITARNTLSLSLPILAIGLLTPIASQATVLSFEDLPDPGQTAPAVPDGYGGISWSTGGWDYYSEVQPPYTAHSGSNRAFSSNLDNRFTFETASVLFEGAWFSGGSHYDDGTPTHDRVSFDLYYRGSLVWHSSDLAVSAVPTFLAGGYSGLVDEVGVDETVARPANTDFVMDDVTFHAATPEPASYVLLLAGSVIGFLAVAMRRFRLRSPLRPSIV